MKPIKVAHITTISFSLKVLLLNQLRNIQQAGYEVVGISAHGPEVPVLERVGIRHIAVPMTRSMTPLADLVALQRLSQVLRRERCTIVHTHNPKPGLLGQLAARIVGVPIVINTLHGFYFHDRTPAHQRRFYILMEKIAARCSDIILSQNSEDIQTAINERICPPQKIKYLGNGIDLHQFDRARINEATLEQKRRELQLPAGVPVIGFVGRLVGEKGILELMAAARNVVQQVSSNIRFLFIGPLEHEKADALSPAIAQDYGLSDLCIFTGLRQDMPELYALMDLFVLPSHREGFPRSPMEASAMQVPCVVTDIRGCREAVEHQRNGLLVPLGDVSVLTEAVTYLLTHPSRAQQMGQEGRRIAQERFDEQKVFKKVTSEYEQLLYQKGLLSPEAPTTAIELPS